MMALVCSRKNAEKEWQAMLLTLDFRAWLVEYQLPGFRIRLLLSDVWGYDTDTNPSLPLFRKHYGCHSVDRMGDPAQPGDRVVGGKDDEQASRSPDPVGDW